MNYSEQKSFLEEYNFHWMLASAVLGVAASLLLRERTLSSQVFFVMMLAIIGTVNYLPKYLHIHFEPGKRYKWAVRVRWILIASGALLALALSPWQKIWWLATAASALWLLLSNMLVNVVFRTGRVRMLDLAVVYFITDFWLIVALSVLGVNWILVAGLLAIAAHFALVLHPERGLFWFPMFIAVLATGLLRNANPYDAAGFEPSFLIVLVALVCTAASILTMTAVKHAERNRKATIADLSTYTGLPPAEAEQRLLSSHADLIASWEKAQPDENDSAVLAKWYADNSLPYLFDNASFHLGYKHITFTLDVLKLSRGRCLDYGAGTGELSVEMAEQGRQVTYVDVPGASRQFAEWSAARAGLTFNFFSTKEEITAEAKANGLFNSIISLDVLEHLPNLETELDYLCSVLAPGGRMILTVPTGATKSQPMHLSHSVQTKQFLANKGLIDIKEFAMQASGSEILRKPICVVMEKPR